MHALFADQFGDGVEGSHQHDERRDDAGHEAGENLAALLEDADEVLADGGQPAELFFLGNVLQLVLELLDGDAGGGERPLALRWSLRKNDEVVTRVIETDLAM